MTAGNFTLAEIQSQPEVWADGLAVTRGALDEIDAIFQRGGFDQVLFTGCGSTYYLSIAAAAQMTDLSGRMARALPASELWFHPELAYPNGARTLLVAVSRSGETSETLRACQNFLDAQGGPLVTISCYTDCALSKMGQVNLVFPSAGEQSLAQTRSFSTMYLATGMLAATAGGRRDLLPAFERLPEAARRLLDTHGDQAQKLGEDAAFDRFYFLGSGLRYGLACELSLKMKEMSLSHSEPFHFMEFRHGPKSMVTRSTLVVGLRSERDRQQESAVLEETAAMGATLLVLDEAETEVAFQSGVPEMLRGPLYLPVGQLVACRHALAKGLNPDQPANLTAVVRL